MIRRWGEFALLDASVGQTFLHIASATGDSARHEKCMSEAQRTLQAIDLLLGNFRFEHDQLAAIVEARNKLAGRLASMRHSRLRAR